MVCESYATMGADRSVKLSTSPCRLLQRLFRCDVTSCLVADSPRSSWSATAPQSERAPGVMARGHRGNGWSLRGIDRNKGAGLLDAIQERFEQLAHGYQGIVIKQRSHPL